MHIEDTIGQTDTFVTKQWEVRIFEHTMHSDCKLRGIWECLCSDLHFSMAHQNVVGVEVSLVSWIGRMWRNNELTFYDNEIEFWSLINIHVKVKTSWDMDRLTFHRSKLHSPSSVMGPVVYIGEEETVECGISLVFDINLQGRGDITRSFGGKASDLSFCDSLDCADNSINCDFDVSDICWEPSTGEGNRLSSLNCTKSWRNCGQIWSHCRCESDGVGEICFGTVDKYLREAVMGLKGTVDSLDTEELDFCQSDRARVFSVPSVLVVLWLRGWVLEVDIVPT